MITDDEKGGLELYSSQLILCQSGGSPYLYMVQSIDRRSSHVNVSPSPSTAFVSDTLAPLFQTTTSSLRFAGSPDPSSIWPVIHSQISE
jgi:hypothetical protein